ncbi:RHS repeat-associated core domain-containing protein [Pseudomonas sp. TWI929]|uniref:RHS repeat-associated core domain-containing protein n=1 Tax=Pseudomonas sp. TWI929 TaxID=3136795 RepID=UPI0032081CA9
MSKAPNNSLFFYRGDQLVTVKQDDQHRAIFRNGALPLAERRTSINESVGLLATDNKGSVLTVQDADEKESHAFAACGNDPGLPSRRTLLGFNGERIAPLSKDYPLGKGYRNYNPCTMRFNASDMLSPFGAGGLNAYVYCLGDPVNRTDPSGRISFRSLVKRVMFRINLKAMRRRITGTNSKIEMTPSSQAHQAPVDKPTLRIASIQRTPDLHEDSGFASVSAALSQRSRSASTTSYDSDSSGPDVTPEGSTNDLPYFVATTIRSRDDGPRYHDPFAPR